MKKTKNKEVKGVKKAIREPTSITLTFNLNIQGDIIVLVVSTIAKLHGGEHQGGGTDLRTNIRDDTYEFTSRLAANHFIACCKNINKMRIKSITKLED
jgi:hypothetical protein